MTAETQPNPQPLPGDGFEQACRVCRHVGWREEFKGGLCVKCRELFPKRRQS